MSRAIVNVSTGHYVRGQLRLWHCEMLDGYGLMRNGATLVENDDYMLFEWTDTMPPGSPSHLENPYAFKAHALKAAADAGFATLLWADACILPIRPLDPLWEKIETEGAWVSNNGWRNGEWTCDAAYADLGITREENWAIPHVVATTFGLSLLHPAGKAIFDEYLRLAQTNAFKGPWWNANNPGYGNKAGAAPCGPPEVLGHRHDQTALSVLAWRNGVKLTPPPEWFAYRGGEIDSTILVADSNY